jgi:antitoxin ParD1/3/4
MATMNVSLPDEMKEWVEAMVASGRYANASDYVRDVIRKDQDKQEKIAHWKMLIAEADNNPAPHIPAGEAFARLRARFDESEAAE